VVREQLSLVAENRGVTFTDIYMGSSSLTDRDYYQVCLWLFRQ